MVATGRALDVAVQGEALIAVQAPDGSEGYTRRGDLSLTPAGLLVNGEGYPVLGESGPIQFQTNDKDIAINRDGTITVPEKPTS